MLVVTYVQPLIFATAVQRVVVQNQLTICHRLVLLPEQLTAVSYLTQTLQVVYSSSSIRANKKKTGRKPSVQLVTKVPGLTPSMLPPRAKTMTYF